MRTSLGLLSALAIVGVVGCGSGSKVANAPPPVAALKKTDTVVGTGAEVKDGDTVFVHYRGTLMNGAVFDENKEGDEPFTFVVGKGSVIKGWDQGVPGMKEGGKRSLVIPASLAYGPQGSGEKIPPNSDLMFDIHLVKVVRAEDAGTIIAKILKPGSGTRTVKQGDSVTITFVGRTLSGTELISSKDSGPITFTMGKNMLMARGLEAGIEGMKLNETRQLTLPPSQGMPPMPSEGMRMGPPGYQIFEVTVTKLN